jgi:hypothetical protein
MILIEGTRESLEFFGKLIIAQAHARDDGFQISPRGAGSRFFETAVEKGFYLHRLD